MMYQSKLAIAVKANGKVLREFGDTAFVPFGTEYSLLIKNLNSVRCCVSISIDGKDIADGDSFIVNANTSMEIERFLKNGNMSKGNRFKFIERTAGVEAHRGGAQVEDGIIRVEFEFEREVVPYKQYVAEPVWPVWPSKPWYPPYKPYWDSGTLIGSAGLNDGARGIVSNTLHDGHTVNCSATATSSAGPANALYSNAGVASAAAAPAYDAHSGQKLSKSSGTMKMASALRSRSVEKGRGPSSTMDYMEQEQRREIVNEAGITAAGSISNQQFRTVSGINGDGVKHAMVVRLLGEVGQTAITQPVTVKSKPKCTSCGRTNKATSRFCVECGTSLEII